MVELEAMSSEVPAPKILARDRRHGRPISRRPLRSVLADMERSAAILAESGDEAAGRVGVAIREWLSAGSAGSLDSLLGISDEMACHSITPVLMRDSEVISLKEAAFRAGKSEKTISRWCIEDGIGRRTSAAATWEISAVALEAKRYGDLDALSALRSGDFGASCVVRYRSILGLEE